MPTKNISSYLFLGEEDFLKEEAIEKLKAKVLDAATRDLNYSIFYAKDKNFSVKQLTNALNTMPFISKKRLIVLKGADSLLQADKKSILSYLSNAKESSVFVIESSSVFIKGEFLLEAAKAAQLVYFRRLTETSLNSWLVKQASAFSKKISHDAIEAIKESLPNNLRILSSHMENIILYVGKRPGITKEDVEKVIGKSPSHTAFDIIGSIERKDAKKALQVFGTLKRDRKSETELLGLIAWSTRMILRVKELLSIKNKVEMRRDLALNPRMFDQITRHASRFNKREILGLLDEILKADLDIKTGMPPRTVIERLIVRMCS